MKIIEKALSELLPYENNPRDNDQAVPFVLESIKEFGFKVPIIIDKNNVIVAGHTRYKAAEKLGLEIIPCIVADDLTDDQIKAFRLADNKVAEKADWDFNLLEMEMANLADFNMAMFGFDEVAAELQEKLAASSDDYEEEVPENPKTVKGDIYKLGKHRLMCGSSTNKEDVQKLLGEEQAKLLFTSPPYSDMRDYKGDKNLEVDNIAQFIAVYRPYAEYQCVNLGIQRKEKEIVQYWDEYISIAKEAGYKLMAWNVWDKMTCGSIGQQKAFFPIRHEWIFVFGCETFELNKTWRKKDESINARKNKAARKVRQKDGSMKASTVGDDSSAYKKMESVLQQSPELGEIRSEHPATFPIALPLEYILAMTDQEDNVIEPFGGSGTTLIACEEANRNCFIMELDEGYCDVIIKRWEKMTGEIAELLT